MTGKILDHICLAGEQIDIFTAVRYTGTGQGYRVVSPPEQDNMIIAGVATWTAQRGCEIGVQKAGIARCLASGQIELGDPVLALAGGAVCSIYEWTNLGNRGPFNCLGFAERMAGEDVVEVFLSMHQRVE